ncbi:MAG: restriction endonuclease subunit S [Desulfovibrio sp.]|nr:restriction endonuclease subunit S [Desulfovibrio sp.]
MGLRRYKLGDIIELYNQECDIPNLSMWDVSGVNADKEFFEPSKQVGNDTSKYKLVPINYFACNLMHVGRDCVLPIALNYSDRKKIVSPAYTIFKIKENIGLLIEYFFMMLKSEEQDRYFWFHADSSIRDGMTLEDFCDLEIKLPSIHIQKKYVDIYKAMVANQQAYERGLDDLKLVCDGFIDNLRKKSQCETIAKYLIESDIRNEYCLTVKHVKGLATSKELITTKADMNCVNLDNYKTVLPGQIVYVQDTSRRGNKISLGFNNSSEKYLVSSISTVFSTNHEYLLPEYLMLYFTRPEFDRYARFHSWGSARETFDWDAMCDVKIPIPDIQVQKAIAEIYAVYIKRKKINEQLKAKIKEICPILIKGSLEEAR